MFEMGRALRTLVSGALFLFGDFLIVVFGRGMLAGRSGPILKSLPIQALYKKLGAFMAGSPFV